MSDRIRLLEDALGALNRTHELYVRRCSTLGYHPSMSNGYAEQDDEDVPTHPLLKTEMLSIKSSMGLYTSGSIPGGSQQNGRKREEHPGDPTHRPGTSSSMDVDLPYEKQRGSSEDAAMSLEDHISERTLRNPSSRPSTAHTDYSAHIARLSDAFPVASPLWLAQGSHSDSTVGTPEGVVWRDHDRKLALREYIRNQLPARREAEYLWEHAKKHALWQYNPHPSPTFFTNLVHHVYSSHLQQICPRRLALLFMILAVGCHVDIDERRVTSYHGSTPQAELENPRAEHYHQLARASLCEIPIMDDTNVDVVLALFWEIWYLLVFSDRKKAAGYAWGIMGLTAKLAQSIGLHRNSGKSKVIPEEVEKRRALFWELAYLDARLSLSLGRPPSLAINHIDCQRPSYTPDEGVDIRESSHHFQEWKHSCYVEYLSPVLEAISKPATNLEYSTVIELDRRIRDSPIPDILKTWDYDRPRTAGFVMQQASVSTSLEAVLLQLHRGFFTRALSGFDEAFNRKHRYAPSVVAVFLSASRMIASIQDLYKREPEITSRILGFWSNAFSSAVALCMLISRAPFTCVSPAALQELERVRILFRTAKDTSPRAMQVLPILESMIDKANDIYNRWYAGQEIPTMILRHTNDDGPNKPSGTNGHAQKSDAPDPFANTHPSLAQCIVECHERAKILFPSRKACTCSGPVEKACPPSHSWMPPPQLSPHQKASPVLPPEAPSVRNAYYNGSNTQPSPPPYHHGGSMPYDRNGVSGNSSGLYSNRVLPIGGPALPVPPPISTLSPASKMAVVDTLNFELGALNVNTEHNWMAFF
ncbi:hypothetical protein FA15DRAFT_670505 [Coprinopsis marcescibilis]|uniref:Xylanolytic transcriptional activator regulatory domain-containing protein n=1 Tax=Coprinopsis marcescibilis TaxID=230819 RepID=A0A5C3KS96_COPMA|nr:hypothetical protein FA15DRAFT_670505 [Coprinopsis marcescibilis]